MNFTLLVGKIMFTEQLPNRLENQIPRPIRRKSGFQCGSQESQFPGYNLALSLQIQVGQAPLITGKVCMFFDEFYLRKPLRDFNPFDLGMAFSTELLPYLCSLYHTG